MITSMIIKEVKYNLLTLRFVVGLLFVVVIYSGGTIIFCKKYTNEKEKDIDNQTRYESSIAISEQGIDKLYEQPISLAKYLELSNFFTSGNESRFPKGVVISPQAPQGAVSFGGMVVGSGGKNFKMGNYTDFDLSFIIGIVLSFLALVLAFDSISRDREEGTLKQQLSNNVPRVSILFGKFVAILILLLINIIVGTLISVIIFMVIVGHNFIFSFPIEIILSGVLSIIYLSIYIWLGLWISSSVSKSSTSLAFLLLVWIVVVILSPYIGGMIAQRYYPVVSQVEHNEKFRNLISSTSASVPPEWRDYFKGKGREEDWIKIEKYYERQDDAFEQFTVQRFMELTAQADRAESFNFYLSPFVTFRQGMERLANTGLSYHINFFQAARQYRKDLLQFIKQQDKLDPQSKHHIAPLPQIRSMSNKSIDPGIVPRFNRPPRKLSIEHLAGTMPSASYLLILNIVLFALAHFTFQRMDVR